MHTRRRPTSLSFVPLFTISLLAALTSVALSQPEEFAPLPVPEGDINLAMLRGVQFNASSAYSSSSRPERLADEDLATSFFTAQGDAANLGATPFVELVLPVDATVDLIQVRGNRQSARGYDVTRGRLELFDSMNTLLFSADFDLLPPYQDGDVATGNVSAVRRVRFTFLADEGRTPGFSELAIWGQPEQALPPGSLTTSGAIALGQTVDGVIARPGDRSRFTFGATAGTIISAQVFASRLGSPLDPSLQLLAPDSSELASNNNFPGLSLDPRLDLRLPADGEYTLVVAAHRRGDGGPEFTYQLALERGAAVMVTVLEAPGMPAGADDPRLQVVLNDGDGTRLYTVSSQNPVTLFTAPGDYQLETRLESVERQVPLTLAAGQELSIPVEYDFGRVALQVLEAEGRLAQDASVRFRSNTHSASASGSQLEVRLPAGSYSLIATTDNITSTLQNVLVEPGIRQELTINLRLGRLDIELPGIEVLAAQGIVLASGEAEVQVRIVQDGEVQPNSFEHRSRRDTAQRVILAAHEGPGVVRFVSGLLTLELPVIVVAGQTISVPFDAPALARQYGLSLFSVTIRDQASQIATRGAQLMIMDAAGRTLLALAPDPLPNTTWLTPGNPQLRIRLGEQEQLRNDVPVGIPTRLLADFTPAAQAGTASGGVQVDIIIESPREGEIVRGDQVTVTGRASTTGPAGAARIAIVADVSGSAEHSSGADLDGDGQEETIIQAEAAAGRLLLDALRRIEAQSPGTAFAVTVLRFANKGEMMAPLVHMSDPEGVPALYTALDRIAQEGNQGGTNYVAALDEAVEALGANEQPGNTFILFMTDGAPGDLKSSLDAAARAGLAGVVIHTFGLGDTFQDEISPSVFFPPDPRGGPNILATVAALGALGGTITALPTPADIVQVIPRLPLLELPEAELQAVEITNVTTGQSALSVELSRDGSFQAQVPVSLPPRGTLETNILFATAIAADGVSSATTQVQVRGFVPPALTAMLSTIDQNRGTLETGDVLTLVLTLTNAGPGAATGLDITVPLPDGIVLLPGTLHANQIVTLEEGSQLRVQLDTLPPPGAGRNSLVITFQGVFQGDSAVQATVTSQELAAQVSDDPFTAAGGDPTVVSATR